MTTVPTVVGPLFIEDQGGADQPVALLWPSLFTDHTMWNSQVAALQTGGWRTITLDPPGHGQSPGTGRGFTMDECAEAALQVLDARGVQAPVVLFGTSWGGIVAPRVALRAAGRVRAMVLFNTTAERPTFFSRASARLLTMMLGIGGLDRMVDGMVGSLQLAAETRQRKPELAEDLSKRFRSWNRRSLIISVSSVLIDRDGALHALKTVTVPTLVVSGEEDTLLPTAFSLRIAQTMPNARHIEVPGVAHLTPVEAPDVANKMIFEFLEAAARGV